MKLPGTEKIVPAFSHICLILGLIAAMPLAHAGPEEDYRAGEEAYRKNDVVTAMGKLRLAADAGHAAAQALYAELLDSAELDDEAVVYFERSAAQQHPAGLYGLAKMYLTGEAPAPDAGAAGRLMRQAADLGHRTAVIALAIAFIRSDAKLGAGDPNAADAGVYIQKAAELGDMEAVGALVDGYRHGRYGLAVDPAKAEQWGRKLPPPPQPAKKGGTR